MTPNDIEVLIHCHCCPERHPRFDAPAVQGALRELKINGLIKEAETPGCYNTTSRGYAHIIQLCTTPLPAQAWVNERGYIIEL